jgi:hypothetical protein
MIGPLGPTSMDNRTTMALTRYIVEEATFSMA